MLYSVNNFLTLSRCRDLIFASALFIGLLIHFKSSAIISVEYKNDSLNKKFPLNDPRNPKCPCHKFQKKADIEFKILNQKEKIHTLEASTRSLKTSTSAKVRLSFLKEHSYPHFSKLKRRKIPNKSMRKTHFWSRIVDKRINACPRW